jgi:hypothetical protein
MRLNPVISIGGERQPGVDILLRLKAEDSTYVRSAS